MNKTKTIGLLLIICALFFVWSGITGAGESASKTGDLVVTGVIEQDGDMFLLKEDNGLEYMIQGSNLSEIVGKKVKASGKLFQEGDEIKLKVNKVEEIPEAPVEMKKKYEEYDE